ncbi:MAG: hypothetical protein KF745_12720 [Phycisphaeraceae bacterium]|nr:hypothetical protein [Phycisphaeraceae bacterium]
MAGSVTVHTGWLFASGVPTPPPPPLIPPPGDAGPVIWQTRSSTPASPAPSAAADQTYSRSVRCCCSTSSGSVISFGLRPGTGASTISWTRRTPS